MHTRYINTFKLGKELCLECQIEHEPTDYCIRCHTCLYGHSKQIQDYEYPIVKCLECGQINFWD